MIDYPLLITVAAICLGTSLAGYLRSRFMDRCLRSFDRFHVTLNRIDGKRIWGRMHLTAGGMEITFPERPGEPPRLKTAYLLYASEYPLIQTILRHADRLTADERSLRAADVARSFHPAPLQRLLRRLRISVLSATDSLRDVLGLILGRVQKMQDRYVVAEGASTLTKLGDSVLTEVSSIHDPLLERHVGRRVVVEVIEGDAIHEHVGILKEYSAAFLHVLDVQYPESWTLETAADGSGEAGHVSVTRQGGELVVANGGDRPLLVQALEEQDEERPVDALVTPGEAVRLPVAAEAGRVCLRLGTVRDVDIIVPRTRSTVRHRAEQAEAVEAESAWDMVFDLGRLVRKRDDDEALEARLRAELAADPAAAATAARLGSLLLQRQDLTEAGRWLRVAYNGREKLPDGGRRVLMQLRELARRYAQRSEGIDPSPR